MPTVVGASPGKSDGAIEQLMAAYMGDVPGASVLVLKDGRAVYRKAYGMANLEEHIPATPATNYRLASVSKQFTSAAILLLAQEGKLSIDDHVRNWLPELPVVHEPVTLRHLLTHASGIADYEDLMDPTSDVQVHDDDVLRLLSGSAPQYFAPGTGYRYSNSGYALLALVVARASGTSFQSFLRERIFRPLHMDATHARTDAGPPIAHRAYGYSREGEAWHRTDQSSTSAVLGDGGIYSSIEDLARWDAALYDDRLLNAHSRELAFAPHVKTDEADVRYGFGWRITGDSLWHSGESIGFRNVIVRFPKQRLSVIILSNRDDPEPYATAKSIAALFQEP